MGMRSNGGRHRGIRLTGGLSATSRTKLLKFILTPSFSGSGRTCTCCACRGASNRFGHVIALKLRRKA